MRPTITAVGGVLLAVWLQAYFLGAMRPLGVLPNVLLVMLAYFALMRPASQTLAFGVAGGLMLDMASGVDFGIRLGFYSLFALVAVMTRQLGGSPDGLWTATGLILGGTIAYNLIVLASLIIARADVDLLVAGRITLSELLLNVALGLILYRFWRWLYRPGTEQLSI